MSTGDRECLIQEPISFLCDFNLRREIDFHSTARGKDKRDIKQLSRREDSSDIIIVIGSLGCCCCCCCGTSTGRRKRSVNRIEWIQVHGAHQIVVMWVEGSPNGVMKGFKIVNSNLTNRRRGGRHHHNRELYSSSTFCPSFRLISNLNFPKWKSIKLSP